MANQNLSPTKNALLEKWLRGQLNDKSSTIPRRDFNGRIPLSFAQQRQLFLELLEPGTAINNLSIFLSIKGKLDLIALEQSANKIIARHEALRTKFSFGLGLPNPEVLPSARITISIVDLHLFNINEQLTEARRLAEKEVLKPFDLSKIPLIRITLYQLSNWENLLLLTAHHTIADGWSLGVFLQELIMFYQEIANSKSPKLPELPIQYSDYASWQTSVARSEVLQSEMTYWKKRLAGDLPVLELPTDYQRGPRQTFSGGTHRFDIPQQLMEAIEKLCRQEDVSLFMFLLTNFYILLHRYCGQDEILVGTPIANRNLPELENLIGVFINTLVLRINIAGDPGFLELLKQVRDVSLEAYAHQDLPFEKLVEELKPQRDLSRTPLFQAVFNLQNSPMPKLEIPGLDIGFVEIDRGVSQFDLTLMMSESEGRLHGIVEYNSDLFSSATIHRMFQSYQMLLENAIVNINSPISKLQLITKQQHNHLVKGLNMTGLDFPRARCMHQLFEAQVEQTPDAVAVIYKDNYINYLELNSRANALALHLQTLGIGPDVRVGIFMEKSLEIVEAFLAVLKAGGTYVPISTSFPTERLQFILNDAKVKVLLTNVDPGPIDSEIIIVHLKEKLLSNDKVCLNPTTNVTSENLAYIIYTSGSTGRPKGVMVNHTALVNFLTSMRITPGIKKEELLLSVTSISFDIAALELFLPLVVGATVIVVNKETSSNPLMLQQAINLYDVDLMQATPSTWQLLIDSGWTGKPGLKALCGGELLTRKLADQLLKRVGSLWNMYGPTETTIWSSVNQIHKDDTPITIGQPIGNTQMYILDRYLQPVPIGVVGELHIGGEGLAQGYLNRSQLTSEKFIPDCFNFKPGCRLYKTGDRARYLPGYSIEIMGRIDDQVKIHGHRIELGEIAVVLMQHPFIQEAVVITRMETSGEKRLVAYFVGKNNECPDACELRDFVRKKLPSYMIPATFICMNNLPLTPNGKIDRKALPVPGDTRKVDGYVASRNEVEQILTSIWENVLGIEQVGIHDNFFDLGGASIQSLQVVASASLAGLHLNAESIFEHQTIAELAEQLKKEQIA